MCGSREEMGKIPAEYFIKFVVCRYLNIENQGVSRLLDTCIVLFHSRNVIACPDCTCAAGAAHYQCRGGHIAINPDNEHWAGQ